MKSTVLTLVFLLSISKGFAQTKIDSSHAPLTKAQIMEAKIDALLEERNASTHFYIVHHYYETHYANDSWFTDNCVIDVNGNVYRASGSGPKKFSSNHDTKVKKWKLGPDELAELKSLDALIQNDPYCGLEGGEGTYFEVDRHKKTDDNREPEETPIGGISPRSGYKAPSTRNGQKLFNKVLLACGMKTKWLKFRYLNIR